MSEYPIPHIHEVFSNKFGSTRAVVCSCGFATTYTVLTDDADILGMRHFQVSHEAHLSGLSHLQEQNRTLLDALESVASLLEFHEDSAKPEFEGAFPTIRVNGDDWQAALNNARAAIAQAKEQHRKRD